MDSCTISPISQHSRFPEDCEPAPQKREWDCVPIFLRSAGFCPGSACPPIASSLQASTLAALSWPRVDRSSAFSFGVASKNNPDEPGYVGNSISDVYKRLRASYAISIRAGSRDIACGAESRSPVSMPSNTEATASHVQMWTDALRDTASTVFKTSGWCDEIRCNARGRKGQRWH